jgi:hypothetical protein
VPKLGVSLILTLCLPLAACGNHPVKVPDLSQTASPVGVRGFVSPGGDVAFSYPANWALVPRDPPGVATVASGGASATVWGYRTVSIVSTPQAAGLARDRFVASLKSRDPGFVITKTGLIQVFQAPAFEIEGQTRIGGQLLHIRSVHIFRGVGEYVVDMLADGPVFNRVNVQVFQPLLVSLRFYGRPPAATGGARGGSSPSASGPTTGR